MSLIVTEVPRFEDSLNNLTVSLGREAVFTCVVNDLGSYRVGVQSLNRVTRSGGYVEKDTNIK